MFDKFSMLTFSKIASIFVMYAILRLIFSLVISSTCLVLRQFCFYHIIYIFNFYPILSAVILTIEKFLAVITKIVHKSGIDKKKTKI